MIFILVILLLVIINQLLNSTWPSTRMILSIIALLVWIAAVFKLDIF